MRIVALHGNMRRKTEIGTDLPGDPAEAVVFVHRDEYFTGQRLTIKRRGTGLHGERSGAADSEADFLCQQLFARHSGDRDVIGSHD